LKGVSIKEKYIIVKSQLKIGYKKTHNALLFLLYSEKNNILKAHEIKIIILIIKLMFHYQLR